jgi:dTDP-4-dehydrorhamnose reductase
VFRTSWLYTPGGRNFVATMLRLFAGDGPVRVVDDQWGCPTWARPLARQVLSLIERSAREHLSERSGLYHLCGGGACSWYQFACAIRELADPPARAQVQAIDSATFAAPARRPERVVLSCEHARRALGLQLEEWRAQITQAMPEFNARSCDGKR